METKANIAPLQPIMPVLKRQNFPDDFVFGTASSAYQYEGAAFQDGKKPSIWDTFTHEHPERIKDGKNGDVAIDFYNRYPDDVALMKNLGFDAHRFSISWARILPNGTVSGGINPKGVQFYNDLIDALIAKGIEPYATLFHWDLPQALEEEGGFLKPAIVGHFREFAELCFQKFGDRVKYWITLNEPYSYSYFGYILGYAAPGQINILNWDDGRFSNLKLPPTRFSFWQPPQMPPPTASTSDHSIPSIHLEKGQVPYYATHYQLLAHAAVVEVYRKKYQASQGGKIGITLVTNWMEPYANYDDPAKLRGLDFMFGWFMNPITHGDYPDTMKSHAKGRLPFFTPAEKEMLKMSYDFLGLNYYTSNYANAMANDIMYAKYYIPDSRVQQLAKKDGKPIGPLNDSTWIYCCPDGLRELLKYIKKNFKDPIIYITENGVDEPNKDETVGIPEALIDYNRVEYYYLHLCAVQQAIEAGVNVKGYFAWSLLDNFEWNAGYTSRFGLNYVDYKDGLKRYPKLSAIWFKMMMQKGVENCVKTLEK